jgi:hypothetical protein
MWLSAIKQTNEQTYTGPLKEYKVFFFTWTKIAIKMLFLFNFVMVDLQMNEV